MPHRVIRYVCCCPVLQGITNLTFDVGTKLDHNCRAGTTRALLAVVKHGPNFEDLIAALAVNLGLAAVGETAEATGRYTVSMGTKEAVLALYAEVNLPSMLRACYAQFLTFIKPACLPLVSVLLCIFLLRMPCLYC